MEHDYREIMGYSISDREIADAWRTNVRSIEEIVSSGSAVSDFVFHGTSLGRARKIMTDGMEPVDLGFALGLHDDDCASGSYWGTILTASAYAEDTVKERDEGGIPAIIGIRTCDLLRFCDLFPDGNTLDFPLKGLTRLEDESISEKWVNGFRDLDWKESLLDLSAIVAIHQFPLEAGFFMVESSDCIRSRITAPSMLKL